MPQAQGAQLTDHLPQRERTFVARKLRAAWANIDAEAAERDLRALARALDSQHPGGAASILWDWRRPSPSLGSVSPPSLLRTFKSTNPVESMISIARDAHRNVKRWRDGRMALRWIAAGMLEAEHQFRRVNGFRDLHILVRALECHREVIEERTKVA